MDDKQKTKWMVPRDHPAYAMGARYLHIVLFGPKDDKGGVRNCVSVMLPEAQDSLAMALSQAVALGARVVLLCDTRRQALQAAAKAERGLPDHRRVALERAVQGGWKLM